jgi:hypothetical protein
VTTWDTAKTWRSPSTMNSLNGTKPQVQWLYKRQNWTDPSCTTGARTGSRISDSVHGIIRCMACTIGSLSTMKKATLRSLSFATFLCQGNFMRTKISRYRYTDISDEVPWFIKVSEFNCFAGFLDNFKEKNRVNSWSGHYKRCLTVDQIQEDEWITLMKDLVSMSSQREGILNCDERTWPVYPTGMKTWAETGSQNVYPHIDGNEKDCRCIGNIFGFYSLRNSWRLPAFRSVHLRGYESSVPVNVSTTTLWWHFSTDDEASSDSVSDKGVRNGQSSCCGARVVRIFWRQRQRERD